MNTEIRSDNPYSRLVALSKLGVVEDFSRIRTKAVAIVGLGGIGSVAAEMLVRCGIGKLFAFDYDIVELANMNRMFYLRSQVGMTKVDAAVSTLNLVNPDTAVEGYCTNICSVDGFTKLKEIVSRSDLLLCCVDNYTARLSVNRICLEVNKIWMESGVSESAVSGHIQTMIPGRSACFECAVPTMMVGQLNEVKRDGVCAASLPTTMSIVAGLLAQNALKFLLNFGSVTECLSYDALSDYFPAYPILPNPHCPNEVCVSAQKCSVSHPETICQNQPVDETNHKVHVDNEWGIEIVPSTGLVAASHTECVYSPDEAVAKLSIKELMTRLHR